MKVHHHAMLWGGLALVGGLYYFYDKSTKRKAKAMTDANATNFIGKSHFYNATGSMAKNEGIGWQAEYNGYMNKYLKMVDKNAAAGEMGYDKNDGEIVKKMNALGSKLNGMGMGKYPTNYDIPYNAYGAFHRIGYKTTIAL